MGDSSAQSEMLQDGGGSNTGDSQAEMNTAQPVMKTRLKPGTHKIVDSEEEKWKLKRQAQRMMKSRVTRRLVKLADRLHVEQVISPVDTLFVIFEKGSKKFKYVGHGSMVTKFENGECLKYERVKNCGNFGTCFVQSEIAESASANSCSGEAGKLLIPQNCITAVEVDKLALCNLFSSTTSRVQKPPGAKLRPGEPKCPKDDEERFTLKQNALRMAKSRIVKNLSKSANKLASFTIEPVDVLFIIRDIRKNRFRYFGNGELKKRFEQGEPLTNGRPKKLKRYQCAASSMTAPENVSIEFDFVDEDGDEILHGDEFMFGDENGVGDQNGDEIMLGDENDEVMHREENRDKDMLGDKNGDEVILRDIDGDKVMLGDVDGDEVMLGDENGSSCGINQLSEEDQDFQEITITSPTECHDATCTPADQSLEQSVTENFSPAEFQVENESEIHVFPNHVSKIDVYHEENNEVDGNYASGTCTTAEAPQIHRATAEIPQIHRATAEIPQLHRATAEVPQIHRATAEIPQIYRATAEIPQLHRATAEAPQIHRATAEIPQLHRVTAEVPQIHRATAEVPQIHRATAEVLQIHGLNTTNRDMTTIKPDDLATNLIMLFVTWEQEAAIRDLFSQRGWKYRKFGTVIQEENKGSVNQEVSSRCQCSRRGTSVSDKKADTSESKFGHKHIHDNSQQNGSEQNSHTFPEDDKPNSLYRNINSSSLQYSEMSMLDTSIKCEPASPSSSLDNAPVMSPVKDEPPYYDRRVDTEVLSGTGAINSLNSFSNLAELNMFGFVPTDLDTPRTVSAMTEVNASNLGTHSGNLQSNTKLLTRAAKSNSVDSLSRSTETSSPEIFSSARRTNTPRWSSRKAKTNAYRKPLATHVTGICTVDRRDRKRTAGDINMNIKKHKGCSKSWEIHQNEVSEKLDLIQCSLCEEVFPGQEKFDYHVQRHRGERPFPCSVCGSEFTGKKLLIDHHIKTHVL